MTSSLILCEGAAVPPGVKESDHKIVRVAAHGPDANLRLESLGPKLYENLGPVANDLVHLAAYVYTADRLVSRGGKDVFGERWKRRFHFVLPVHARAIWESPRVSKLLVETLKFLSDDSFTFTFVDAGQVNQRVQTYLDLATYTKVTSVALFSGGLDSLAGIVWDHVQNGERSVLVSHRPAPVTNKRQQNLVKILRARFPTWNVQHAPAWIHLDDERDKEYSQRTRSFLYLSLAAAVADCLGLERIKVFENGIVSLNIPILGQTVGTRLTRTTHPKFLKLTRELFETVFNRPLMIDAPFLFLTKGEVAAKLAEVGQADLIEASTSCSHTFLSTHAEPHCGICSQCIDRRLAIMAMDLENHDHVYRYDMFRDSLAVPEAALPKPMVEGYVRTYLEVAKIPIGEFYQRYPEIGDAVIAIGGDQEEAFEAIYELYQRRAAEVNRAVVKEIRAAAQDLYIGGLPDDCLLRVLGSGEHLRDPGARLAGTLGDILGSGLPVTFQSRIPANEEEVQDAAEALLLAADRDLSRELPMVDFLHLKGAKPDFSTVGKDRMFVEVKFPRKTRSASAVADEIAADITIYGEHGASVLFVIYDPHRIIKNPTQFLSRLSTHRGIYGKVIH